MSKNLISNVCKYLSIVLVVISTVMLFFGSLTVADKSERREIQKSLKSTDKRLDVDRDEIEELQDYLDELDIDIDAKAFVKKAKKALNAVKDAKIAPSEIAALGPDVVKLADEFSDEDGWSYYMGYRFYEAVEAVDDAKAGVIALIVLFYLTVIAAIVVIVLHITNSKLPGASVVFFNLVWLIIMGVASAKINSYTYNELDIDDKVVKITGAPVWAFILAFLAMLIWMFKDNICAKFTESIINDHKMGLPAGKVCPNCGKQLSEGALFCSGCGTKFEENFVKIEKSVRVICSNCGTELDPDVAFCPNCGSKVKE